MGRIKTTSYNEDEDILKDLSILAKIKSLEAEKTKGKTNTVCRNDLLQKASRNMIKANKEKIEAWKKGEYK